MIRTEKLCCGYGSRMVLQNVSLSMEAGELWCVLGANGVGKSTLFKTLLGLLKPMGGAVLVDGRPVEQWSRAEFARRVSYVPQGHTPPFPFKVWEVAAMGRNPYQRGIGRLSREDRRVVAEALEILGIERLAGEIYTRISGGERQLTLLARAIAQQTPVMFLDEPVSNLDFGNHARVLRHVRDLAAMGKTVVMTTHCPDHAFFPESRVVLLDRGGVICTGRGTDVVTEELIRRMYGVDNRIVVLNRGDGEAERVCVADC